MDSNSELYTTSKTFRINREIKVNDFKLAVCQFWELNHTEFEFFYKSHILLMRYEETVEMLFFSLLDAQRTLVELTLKIPNRDESLGINPRAKFIKENIRKNDNKKELKKKKLLQKISNIEMEYPGLSQHIRNRKRDMREEFGIDNHVISFVLLFTFIILSIYTITQRQDTTTQYTIDNYIKNRLKSFYSVTNSQKFFDFFQGDFVTFLDDANYNSTSDSGFFKLYVLVGSCSIRIMKADYKVCIKSEIKDIKCANRYYNSKKPCILFLINR